MTLVRPRVIPEISMTPAHRNLRNHNAESPLVCRRHERIHAAIRLTINEIIQIAAPAFLPSLIQDAAAFKGFREEISKLALIGLAKFSFFYVGADNYV